MTDPETPFDELSRGDQFLRLLEVEYMDLLRFAKLDVDLLTRSIDLYYSNDPPQRAVVERELNESKANVSYWEKALGKGAENEDDLPTAELAESPKFEGITCTTVV